MATIKRQPVIYSGSGSAVDNYKLDVPQKATNWGLFDNKNSQHRNILSLMRQAQWLTPHPRHGEVADLSRLSAFLQSDKSPVKKPLMEMTKPELSKIIKAFEGIVTSTFKKSP
jgi:hypothetical protein